MEQIVVESVAPAKRIVVEHTEGPFKGLMQITGTTDDFDGQSPPPITTEPFMIQPGQRMAIAGLVAAKRTYLLYREITKPDGLKSFHEHQQ